MVTKIFQSPLDDEGMSDVFGKPSLSKISVVTKKLTFFLVDIQGISPLSNDDPKILVIVQHTHTLSYLDCLSMVIKKFQLQ